MANGRQRQVALAMEGMTFTRLPTVYIRFHVQWSEMLAEKKHIWGVCAEWSSQQTLVRLWLHEISWNIMKYHPISDYKSYKSMKWTAMVQDKPWASKPRSCWHWHCATGWHLSFPVPRHNSQPVSLSWFCVGSRCLGLWESLSMVSQYFHRCPYPYTPCIACNFMECKLYNYIQFM